MVGLCSTHCNYCHHFFVLVAVSHTTVNFGVQEGLLHWLSSCNSSALERSSLFCPDESRTKQVQSCTNGFTLKQPHSFMGGSQPAHLLVLQFTPLKQTKKKVATKYTIVKPRRSVRKHHALQITPVGTHAWKDDDGRSSTPCTCLLIANLLAQHLLLQF